MLIDRLAYISVLVSASIGYILTNAYFDPQSGVHASMWENPWFWTRLGLIFIATIGVGAFIATFAYEVDSVGNMRRRKDRLAIFLFSIMPPKIKSFFGISIIGGFVLTLWLAGNLFFSTIVIMIICRWVTGDFPSW